MELRPRPSGRGWGWREQTRPRDGAGLSPGQGQGPPFSSCAGEGAWEASSKLQDETRSLPGRTGEQPGPGAAARPQLWARTGGGPRAVPRGQAEPGLGSSEHSLKAWRLLPTGPGEHSPPTPACPIPEGRAPGTHPAPRARTQPHAPKARLEAASQLGRALRPPSGLALGTGAVAACLHGALHRGGSGGWLCPDAPWGRPFPGAPSARLPTGHGRAPRPAERRLGPGPGPAPPGREAKTGAGGGSSAPDPTPAPHMDAAGATHPAGGTLPRAGGASTPRAAAPRCEWEKQQQHAPGRSAWMHEYQQGQGPPSGGTVLALAYQECTKRAFPFPTVVAMGARV